MSTFTDLFARPDGAIGSNYTGVAGFGALEISGGAVRAAAVGHCAMVVAPAAATFSDDHECEVDYTAVANGDRAGPMVRCDPDAGTGYALDHDGNNRSLIRFDGETAVEVNDPWERFAVEPTDVVRLRAVDDQLSVYLNGELLYTKTDATYASGQPGMWYFWDNSRATLLGSISAADVGGGAPDEPELSIETQPTATVSGYVIDPAPVVHVLDADGEIDTAFTGEVTVELLGDGVLLGTTTVDAVAGVATFDDLRACETGTMQLRFSADEYDDVDSEGFSVTGGEAAATGDEMFQSPAIRSNEAQQAKRWILLRIRGSWDQDTDGVKAMLTKGGVLVDGDETPSPDDIVHVKGTLFKVDPGQGYTNVEPGVVITARVPAATGREEALSCAPILPSDNYNPALSGAELAKEVFKAVNGVGGFGVQRQEETDKVLVIVPGEEPHEVDARYEPILKAIVALGAAAT
jgi:hypothetical protein